MASVTASTGVEAALARRAPGERDGLLYSVLVVIASLVFLIPAIGVLYTSLKTDTQIAEHGVWALTGNLTVDNYLEAFSSDGLLVYLRNSFLVTIPAVFVSVALGTLAGFVIAKLKPRGSAVLLVFFVSALFIPPQILLIPLFQLFNAISLYNTLWPMIIVHSAYGIAICTLVMRNFFVNVPDEILEAATVDGASVGRTLWTIVLPLSRPALAALATLQFTFIWNDFLYPLIFTRTESAQTIMVGIVNLQGQYSTAYGAQAAMSVIASVPTVLVFLIFQKQFIAGLTTGAVKG